MTSEREEAGIRVYDDLGLAINNINDAIGSFQKSLDNTNIPLDTALEMALFTLSQSRSIMAECHSLKDLHEGIPGRMEEYMGLIDTYQDKINEVQFY